MRAACGEAALRHTCARRVRLPLRGQHRLARLRRRQASCFPFNCARRSGAREHQNACECRRRCGERQGGAGRQARFPMPGTRGRKPCAAVRAGGSLCYRMRRVRCSHAHSAPAVKRETGGGPPPGLCCPRNGTPPARRASPRTRPCRPRCHCPSAGREGCGLASGQPGYRPTQGASPTLAERPIRGGRMGCAFRPRPRGLRSIRHA
ncbi:uroporphyrin-III C-methyltransferase [Burkholderia lata]|nr:uroporphyrin-III C-methyltransferase [Burkholderia lata]